MREIIAIVVIAALTTGSAFAQPTDRQHRRTAAQPSPRHAAKASLDRGPFTPEANRAYQGGGVILQGAPGAPAPMPEATPPGQAPRNMVPPR